MPTIPLVSNGKKPMVERWQSRLSAEQWTEVGPLFRGNIGVRVGGGIAVVDADSSKAAANIEAYFVGLGLHLPTVATASGDGRHFYLRIGGVPDDFNMARLSLEIGPGELRVRNAYVVAPCSIIGQARYKFVSGDVDAIATLRVVKWRDLTGLLSGGKSTQRGELEAPPVRLLRRAMPPRAAVLLEALRTAPKGQPIGSYPSRSEAEAAVVGTLILAGWNFAEIAAEFERSQPGHFREAGKHRENYLRRTYRNVLSDLAMRPSERLQIAEAYHRAPTLAWPVRGGDLDLATYQALLAIAWQFGTWWEVGASLRDLALYTCRSVQGVSNALKWLQEAELVALRKRGTSCLATVWDIFPPRAYSPRSEVVARLDTSHSIGGLERSITAVACSTEDDEILAKTHFSRNCERIYIELSETPTSAAELARMTNLHRATASRLLQELRSHGLAVATQANHRGEPTGWVRGPAKPADVAKKLDVEGDMRRQRARYQQEREEWQEQCRLSRLDRRGVQAVESVPDENRNP